MLLGRDQPDDVFVQALGHDVRVEVGGKAVLVLLANQLPDVVLHASHGIAFQPGNSPVPGDGECIGGLALLPETTGAGHCRCRGAWTELSCPLSASSIELCLVATWKLIVVSLPDRRPFPLAGRCR